jgi:hypothetical protein
MVGRDAWCSVEVLSKPPKSNVLQRNKSAYVLAKVQGLKTDLRIDIWPLHQRSNHGPKCFLETFKLPMIVVLVIIIGITVVIVVVIIVRKKTSPIFVGFSTCVGSYFSILNSRCFRICSIYSLFVYNVDFNNDIFILSLLFSYLQHIFFVCIQC